MLVAGRENLDSTGFQSPLGRQVAAQTTQWLWRHQRLENLFHLYFLPFSSVGGFSDFFLHDLITSVTSLAIKGRYPSLVKKKKIPFFCIFFFFFKREKSFPNRPIGQNCIPCQCPDHYCRNVPLSLAETLRFPSWELRLRPSFSWEHGYKHVDILITLRV